MTIKPVLNRILVRLHFPVEDGIVLTKVQVGPAAGEYRTKIEVLAVGPNVTHCKVGDFVLIHPDTFQHLIPTSKDPAEGLLDASAVIAIVPDDYGIDTTKIIEA